MTPTKAIIFTVGFRPTKPMGKFIAPLTLVKPCSLYICPLDCRIIYIILIDYEYMKHSFNLRPSVILIITETSIRRLLSFAPVTIAQSDELVTEIYEV